MGNIVTNNLDFSNERILLGITGGIAAYKIPELIRMLSKGNAQVQVVLSEGAKAFVTPHTLQALSRRSVRCESFDLEAEAAMGHIELARWATKILIAPLSANRLAALAHGFADDLLTLTALASRAPMFVAPAMNQQMWQHPAVVQNMETLRQRGVQCIGPAFGEQACQDIGLGRMSEVDEIARALSHQPILSGLKIMITAGPTQEPLCPVRMLTNPSTGRMGYAIAAAAKALGAKVILVSGPSEIEKPKVDDSVDVQTANEMLDAVMTRCQDVDIFISTAAVSDYRPKNALTQKMPKSDLPLTLELVPNPDILYEVSRQNRRPFCVGFAAQSHDGLSLARQKRIDKHIEMIAFNSIAQNDRGFKSETNELTVISKDNEVILPLNTKQALAYQLLEIVHEQFHSKSKA